ncbi:MAG: VCBS repeat-containing protein, partial [Rhodothermales bacterium]
MVRTSACQVDAARLLPMLVMSIVLLLSACSEPSTDGTDAPDGSGNGGFRLTDVTEAAGLAAYRHVNGGFGSKWMPEIVGPGAAFFDFDGDGWQDILLVGGGGWEQTSEESRTLWLYRNRGDGTFDLVSEEAGLEGLDVYPFGLAIADFDNDGDPDVLVTALHENVLLRNDDGAFVDVSRDAGIADE